MSVANCHFDIYAATEELSNRVQQGVLMLQHVLAFRANVLMHT
jgi:hypothetical protein